MRTPVKRLPWPTYLLCTSTMQQYRDTHHAHDGDAPLCISGLFPLVDTTCLESFNLRWAKAPREKRTRQHVMAFSLSFDPIFGGEIARRC